MQAAQISTRVVGVMLALSLFSFTIIAQHRKSGSSPIRGVSRSVPQEPLPTFETLLASDSYKVYVEVRGVGQLIDAAGVNDTLDPVMKFASPPREIKTIVKWLHNHALELSGARMMFATWPAGPRLPQFICAVEFPSVEDAQKFEPQLRKFLTKVLAASESKSVPSPESGKRTTGTQGPSESQPTAPSYSVSQTGSLVLISAGRFAFGDLRPKGSNLLAEDENFRMAHDRFTSEPIFLYFNVALEDKNAPQSPVTPESSVRVSTAPTNGQAGTVSSNDSYVAATPAPETPPVIVSTPEESQPPSPTVIPSPEEAVANAQGSDESGPDPTQALSSIFPLLTGGAPSWPAALAAGIALESESYDLRLLLINNEARKRSLIPFIPQLISGPPLSPVAPSIFPADTELLVTVSLDYGQIYERLLKALARENDRMAGFRVEAAKDHTRETPFAALEKRLGIKLKEELLPLLGSELAVSLPMKAVDLGPPKTVAPVEESSDNSFIEKTYVQTAPVIAVSLTNKEAAHDLLPRIIQSFGFKGVTLLAQTEKREGTELVSYGDLFSYLFIEDFLLISSDAKALRHIVDSYSNHDTLGGNNHFRNGTQWQPRHLLGQIYVSPSLMESYTSFVQKINNENMQELLARLSPVAQPVTYAVSNEGSAVLHEIHIPRSLVMLAVAGISGEVSASPMLTNEAVAQSVLRTIASAEETYKATSGDGRFGGLDELISQGLVSRESLERYGYRIEVNINGTGFEASAAPVEYGKTGKQSFFIDQSSVLRAGDHAGGAATIADSPVR